MSVPETYRSNILTELDSMGLESIWKLRGNLHVLKNYMIQNPSRNDELILKNIEELLDVSNDLYKFLTTIKGSVSAADFNKLARLLDTGGKAFVAVEEIITAEDFNITDIIMSGVSLVMTYMGNTAYISSALENCETQVAANTITVYDRLWALIHEHNKDPAPQDIKRMNETMNAFFQQLSNRTIKLPDRILIITRLYQLLCMIYLAGIIKNINWVHAQEA